MDRLVQQARDKALALLQPTPAQLERGLELHRQSVVVDAYAFAPYTIPAGLERTMAEANEAGLPAHDLSQLLLSRLVTGRLQDVEAMATFVRVMRDTGVTCIVQNAGEGRNIFESLERMALFTHVCDEAP